MNAQAFAAEYGFARATTSLDEVLDDSALDAVIICSPSEAHADQTERALRAGKHVLCEIPLATSLGALLMLIPEPDPGSIALGLAVVAGLGLVRVAQNLYPVFRGRTGFRNWLQPVRRIGWTVIADLVLIFTAWRIWSSGDVAVIQNLVTVAFVLLVGAADVSWQMLVEVSREQTS